MRGDLLFPGGMAQSRVHVGFLRWMALISVGLCSGMASAATLTNLFFLHHSTGSGLINGGMRTTVAAYNASHGADFAFWDHGYNNAGLTDPAGARVGVCYNIPGDNTDPDGLYDLWTSIAADAVACRTAILSNHEVIAFKSCYPASNISDTGELAQYKAWYLAMRNVFDQYPQRLFVVMSTPPLHRLSTSGTAANNARLFANWLKSVEYLAGHDNVVCFDLFDYLAGADNMLKYEYEKSHGNGDSHPNTIANQTVGPIFAQFLIDAALAYSANTNLDAPRNVRASDGAFDDRVTVTWQATARATRYAVWRHTQRDVTGAAILADNVVSTTCTDTNVALDTTYWYWVYAANDEQISAVSVPNKGYASAVPPLPVTGPVIRANGETGGVAVVHGDTMFATVALNAGPHAGVPADWWVLAVPASGNWYYLNSAMRWMPFGAGNIAACQPVYQGGACDLPETTVLDPVALSPGAYNLYFALDELDGRLDPGTPYRAVVSVMAE